MGGRAVCCFNIREVRALRRGAPKQMELRDEAEWADSCPPHPRIRLPGSAAVFASLRALRNAITLCPKLLFFINLFTPIFLIYC